MTEKIVHAPKSVFDNVLKKTLGDRYDEPWNKSYSVGDEVTFEIDGIERQYNVGEIVRLRSEEIICKRLQEHTIKYAPLCEKPEMWKKVRIIYPDN